MPSYGYNRNINNSNGLSGGGDSLASIERPALRKLVQLDLAERIDDMRVPPGNRLESLADPVDVEGPLGIFAAIASHLGTDARIRHQQRGFKLVEQGLVDLGVDE